MFTLLYSYEQYAVIQDSYSSLLPLYFPRSPQEELYAAHRLPADVGNEDGEPVIAERKIRIAASPAISECWTFFC